MRAIEELLHDLDEAVQGDAARQDGHMLRRRVAERLAPIMPWIHRTGRPGAAWGDILAGQRLVARTPCTQFERDLRAPDTVYFFAGYAAYPKGGVAFVLSPLYTTPGTFCPFDTGALEAGHLVRREHGQGAGLLLLEQAQLFQRFSGSLLDLKAYLGLYLAAHFQDPRSYLLCAQHSEPDHHAFHGLLDKEQDRRAWTIEAQVHQDVQLPATNGALLRVILENRAFLDELEELAPQYLGLACVRDEARSFEHTIVDAVERLVNEALA